MKAIHVDKFVSNVTDLKPTPISNPSSKSSQDIHVKITHAAATHVDLLYAQGLHQNNRRHVQPPFILGTEYAGIITHSPPSSFFPPGTRVFGGGLGAYAEQICVSEPSIRRVPSQWTNAEACAVGASGAVSCGALISVAQLKAGETVLVLGASGGLGVMAVQIAKAVGARVIAVVGGEEKAERFGEDGRRDPQRTKDVWDGFMKLVEDGQIRPVIYKEDYWGLETVSRALEGVRDRKAWGRAVIRICEAEVDKTEQKARL
ncbi:hypothetical protein J4E90_006669 [Alternaria incomplexa]|uniref:uncharacterized protein n=1 Tax=Alternaria incomplexa TaxID=1187928 RepID=UPI00221F6BC2|nr:uncharacterized protein J4E90_006669 [Alternaria incomplexa]KAI4911852.1 hypothetical protein J4E90_006669 [Alternaria incomplexa]